LNGQDVDQAVEYAEKAFREWSDMSASERGSIMRKFALLVKAKAADLAKLDAAAMGRPVSTNLDGVAFGGLFEYIAGLGESVHGESSLNTNGFLTMKWDIFIYRSGYHLKALSSLRQPFGVTAGILPWNFPIVRGLI
jgi:aldehyde dehydrogenase (NAD+)